jgi:D-sedoheptulose 7-phosphate isomerase
MTAQICIDALKRGNKILICGNGGSAAQAQHFAAELVVRYKKNRKALPCIALTADSAILTACANDFGYETVFARQVEAYGNPGDVLIAISTSGKSANVLAAIDAAKKIGMEVIDMNWILKVPDGFTAAKQEAHLNILHDWARDIEDAFCD